jgi:signal peptidase II
MSSKTKSFIIAIFPLIVTMSLDQTSKSWAKNIDESLELGILKFQLVYNHGIILGWLSNLPLTVKSTLLTTLGAIILSSYILFILVVPLRSIWLRLGLSILTGGIIGNVIDRLRGPAVIDFIGFSFFESSLYLNLADIFQWLGYFFIIIGIYQDSHYFWPKHDWRKSIYIKKRFQIRFALFLSTVIFFVGFIFIFFGYSFFKQSEQDHFEIYYFLSGFSVLIFLSGIGFLAGLNLSHRIAGPIYALEKYIKESLDGNKAPFTLRRNDEFKELQEVLTKLNIILNQSKIISKDPDSKTDES